VTAFDESRVIDQLRRRKSVERILEMLDKAITATLIKPWEYAYERQPGGEEGYSSDKITTVLSNHRYVLEIDLTGKGRTIILGLACSSRHKLKSISWRKRFVVRQGDKEFAEAKRIFSQGEEAAAKSLEKDASIMAQHIEEDSINQSSEEDKL